MGHSDYSFNLPFWVSDKKQQCRHDKVLSTNNVDKHDVFNLYRDH